MKWISIKEQEPQKDKQYLALCANGVQMQVTWGYAIIYINKLWENSDDFHRSMCITHYMELPEPPRKDT